MFYGFRKVEVVFFRDGFRRDEVVVVYFCKIENFIGNDIIIVVFYEMDLFGLGLVSMMFMNGGKWMNYIKVKFFELVERINCIREGKKLDFKFVVGGLGVW